MQDKQNPPLQYFPKRKFHDFHQMLQKMHLDIFLLSRVVFSFYKYLFVSKEHEKNTSLINGLRYPNFELSTPTQV